MLTNLRFRTKLALLVAIPLIAALAVALPGVRARLRDLDTSDEAIALLGPANRVSTVERRIADEGSLSAWWLAANDPTLETRLQTARTATDRAVRELAAAERDASAAGAGAAAARIHDLRESAALIGQQRQFVDLRFTPDASVLGYFRDLSDDAAGALDTLAGAPSSAAAALRLRDLATLTHLDAALGDERAVLTLALARGQLSDTGADSLVAASTRQNSATTELEQRGAPGTRAVVDQRRAALRGATDEVRRLRAPALTARQLPTVSASRWYDAATAQLTGWRTTTDTVTRRIRADLDSRRDDARSALLAIALGSVGVLLLAAFLAVLIARATTRPLRRLADNANDVASNQLPALVDTLRDPDALMPPITPITVQSRDELGDLAKAFNRVERTTVEVAELQREALATGISDLYVNLARRNQQLLERQLAVIEDLEADERDADHLEAYFALDHLATRMRRNSDSLLVLAGVEQDEGVRTPVPLLDVVRGAVSETGDFRRVHTAGIPARVDIAGYAAADLAHLLSELLENATAYSAPATQVTVVAQVTDSGLDLTVTDKGIGIPEDRLAALNSTLSDPPPPGLVLSRSLGLVVAGRLAHRIGVHVQLRSAPDVGTAAVVTLPRALLRIVETATRAAGPAPDAFAGPHETERVAPVVDLVAEEHPAGGAPTTAGAESPRPAPVLEAVPSPGAAHGDDPTTAAGLPRRVPKAPGTPPVAETVATPPARPPDAVFELVARYEAGRRRARDDAHGDSDAGAGDPGGESG